MKKQICLLIIAIFMLTGCGFKLQGTAEIPEQFKLMHLQSNNPYGLLSREIKTALQLNGVKLVARSEKDNNKNSYPSLHILSSSITRDTISVYQDGKSAEYQIILTVNAQVIIAGKDIYPITTKIFRTFFDNPATALAKTTEETLIENEMYKQAANQIISKLRTVNAVDEKLNTP